jgi:glutamine---fructose-6-phosphate transaminase (isomerizing)
MLEEIREQPRALAALLQHEDRFAGVAAILREREVRIVRMVGHGSSDNAASYGIYAFGLLPRWTALRDSITLTVHYDAGPELAGFPVVALSQSGRTPDVVAYVERARELGAYTIALTNDEQSELALAAQEVLPLAAGPEQAIAATKTYVNQLAALGLLAAHAAGEGARFREGLLATIEALDAFIPAVEAHIREVAQPYAFTGRMFVIGRGAEFATAREIALKLLETCRIAAEALTATGLSHGPVAALDPLFPVWAIASHDGTLPTVLEAANRAREAGAALIASGSAAAELEGADHVLEVPKPASPLLGPLLSVVPGQLFAWAVAQAKGLDPDRPRGLDKVTLAR